MTPRRELVEPNAPLSMRWQCELLGVNRSSLYYEPVEPDGEQLALMRRMDELHLKHPFFGSRMMTQILKAEGSAVNRKRVQRLMRLMGLESTAPKPNTSKPAPEHTVYPYLLRNLTVSRINQVWAADITYIPMARGFVYLVAVIDWYSRRVLAWRLSNTLETTFCVEAVNEAVARYGRPEIFNTDQGSQFSTGQAFAGRSSKSALQKAGGRKPRLQFQNSAPPPCLYRTKLMSPKRPWLHHCDLRHDRAVVDAGGSPQEFALSFRHEGYKSVSDFRVITDRGGV